MSRLATCFQHLRSRGRRALIPFLMAADPQPDWTLDLMSACVRSGADILELGVPFSDPMADGPTIQKAHERALRHGFTLRRVLDLVRDFRRVDQQTPVVLMGYLNPVEALGYDEFAQAAAAAGVDGVILVDLPVEESAVLDAGLASAGIDLIFLIAPTTGPARTRKIVHAARGFIYYVSLRGVTGAQHLDWSEAAARIGEIQTLTRLPVGVGFGIDGPEAARAAASFADAIVVGSALVSRIAAARDRADAVGAVDAFIASLRGEIDRNEQVRA